MDKEAPTEPGGPGPDRHELATAAHRIVHELGAVMKGETVLVTVPADRESNLADLVLEEVSRCASNGLRLALPGSPPENAEVLLREQLAHSWPDIIIELADLTLYQCDIVTGYLQGGGRVLSLPSLEGTTAKRLLESDLASVNLAQEALVHRLSSARSVVITTADARLELRLDPPGLLCRIRKRLRRDIGFLFALNPVPVTRGLLAFIPGQVSLLGRMNSMNGRFIADGQFASPRRAEKSRVPFKLEVQRGVVDAHRDDVAELDRPGFACRPRVRHLSIGLLPGATCEGSLLEAERVHGAVTLGFGDHPWHFDAVAAQASVSIDGATLISRGRLVETQELNPRAPVDVHPAITRCVATIRRARLRNFAAAGGHMGFVGTCPQEAGWLTRFCGRAIAPVAVSDVRMGALRKAMRDTDLCLLRLPPARLMVESLHRRVVEVPMLVESKVDLAAIAARGIDALATSSDAKKQLKNLRKQGTAWSAALLDGDTLRRFHREYYLPTIRRRYGSRGGYKTVSDFAPLIGKAHLIWIRDADGPAAAQILAVEGNAARLVQGGVLHGDESLVKRHVTASNYLFGAELAAKLGATSLNLGGSLPFLRDGVLRYKATFSSELEPPRREECYAFHADFASAHARRFLAEHPMIVRTKPGHLAGLALVDQPMEASQLAEFDLMGLTTVVLLASGSDRMRDLRAAARETNPRHTRFLIRDLDACGTAAAAVAMSSEDGYSDTA